MSLQGIVVALRNYEVRIYNDKTLVNLFKMPDLIFGLKFGRFAGYANSLIMLTESGNLIIRSLLDNISLDVYFLYNKLQSISYKIPQTKEEDIVLNVPKKTKLYLDFIEREKEFATGILFQLN